MKTYYIIDLEEQKLIKVSKDFQKVINAEQKKNNDHKVLLGLIEMSEEDTRKFIKEKLKKGEYKDEETYND